MIQSLMNAIADNIDNNNNQQFLSQIFEGIQSDPELKRYQLPIATFNNETGYIKFIERNQDIAKLEGNSTDDDDKKEEEEETDISLTEDDMNTNEMNTGREVELVQMYSEGGVDQKSMDNHDPKMSETQDIEETLENMGINVEELSKYKSTPL